MRFFGYHLMGQGKFISKEELSTVYPLDLPPVLTYIPDITEGTQLEMPSKRVPDQIKVERSHSHKRRRKADAAEKKAIKESNAAAALAAREAQEQEWRKSVRCLHCDRPFIQDFRRIGHQTNCRDKQKLTMAMRKDKIINGVEFDTLKGHCH